MSRDTIKRALPASVRRAVRRVIPARPLELLSHRPYDTYDEEVLQHPPDFPDSLDDDLPDPPTLPPSYEIEASVKALGLPKPQQFQILQDVDAVMGRVTPSLLSIVDDSCDILALSSAILYGCTEAAAAIKRHEVPQSEDELDHLMYESWWRIINSVTAAANIAPLGKQVEVAVAAAAAITEVSYNTLRKTQEQYARKGPTAVQYIVALGWASSAASCLAGQAHGIAGNIAQRRLLILAEWSSWSKEDVATKRRFLPTLAHHKFI